VTRHFSDAGPPRWRRESIAAHAVGFWSYVAAVLLSASWVTASHQPRLELRAVRMQREQAANGVCWGIEATALQAVEGRACPWVSDIVFTNGCFDNHSPRQGHCFGTSRRHEASVDRLDCRAINDDCLG